MLTSVRKRLSYANVMATVALFLALGGGAAYAANTVFSEDIVNGEVKTADLAGEAVAAAKLADNAVTGGKVANNSLTGADIAEETLAGQPRTFLFRADNTGGPFQEILRFGGLTLEAKCLSATPSDPAANLELEALTTTSNASIVQQGTITNNNSGDVPDGLQAIDFDAANRTVPADRVELDRPLDGSFFSWGGTLHYTAADGSRVTAIYSMFEAGLPDGKECLVSGHAFRG